jgi:hypothetical protein
MDDEGLLEAARSIRHYLPDLVGPAADQLDRQVAELLATAGRGENTTAALRSLLNSNSVTKNFVAKVLADAPHYRPHDLQPDYLRTGGMQPPPGTIGLPGPGGPVLHAGKYSCPHGDYVWYRSAVGVPVKGCPTHHCPLTRI